MQNQNIAIMPTINKLMKGFFLMFILSATSFAFSSCGNAEAADKTGKEYTSTYICPMHCKGSGSETAGTCPVCKMDYVRKDGKVEQKGHEGHDHGDHGHDHSGHDHSGHSH